MNDFISIFKNDLLELLDKLLKKNIINQSFNSKNISIDYQSKSKKGDISTNIFILLNKEVKDKNFDLNQFLSNELDNLA